MKTSALAHPMNDPVTREFVDHCIRQLHARRVTDRCAAEAFNVFTDLWLSPNQIRYRRLKLGLKVDRG